MGSRACAPRRLAERTVFGIGAQYVGTIKTAEVTGDLEDVCGAADIYADEVNDGIANCAYEQAEAWAFDSAETGGGESVFFCRLLWLTGDLEDERGAADIYEDEAADGITICARFPAWIDAG